MRPPLDKHRGRPATERPPETKSTTKTTKAIVAAGQRQKANVSAGQWPTGGAALDAALAFAAGNWPVFPCRPNAKVPIGGLVPNGCKDATTDANTIAGWWARVPCANIGIATGAPGPDVVDVDTKHGAPGLATLARLKRAGLLAGACRLVRTPSGGLHLYFAGSAQGNGALRRHGIDFRGRGGYVLAPPSVVDGNAYEVLDARPIDAAVDFGHIRRFLDPPRPAASAPRQGGNLGSLATHVARQGAGNRNSCLYWAACRATQEGASLADLAVLVEAAVAAELDEAEARRTVASAYRRFGGAQ